MQNRIIYVFFTFLAAVLLVLSAIGAYRAQPLDYLRVLYALTAAVAFWLGYGWGKDKMGRDKDLSLLVNALGVAMVLGVVGTFLFPAIFAASPRMIAGTCMGPAVAALVSAWRERTCFWSGYPAPHVFW